MVRSALLCMVILLAVACGAAPKTDAGAMALRNTPMALAAATDTCAQIEKRLQNDQEALRRTKQWHAMIETSAYADFVAAMQRLEQAGCDENEESPSEECQDLVDDADSAYSTLQLTAEWSAVTHTPEFKKVNKDVDEGENAHCWS